jgi:elongation factor Tu
MAGPPHIEAEIEYVTTEAGGRSTPAFSGYRPQFYYHGRDWDAEHIYPETEEVSPGDTVKAHLRFLSPKEHHGKISVGMPFLIREGARTVAYGIVTKVFDQLEVDAADLG